MICDELLQSSFLHHFMGIDGLFHDAAFPAVTGSDHPRHPRQQGVS